MTSGPVSSMDSNLLLAQCTKIHWGVIAANRILKNQQQIVLICRWHKGWTQPCAMLHFSWCSSDSIATAAKGVKCSDTDILPQASLACHGVCLILKEWDTHRHLMDMMLAQAMLVGVNKATLNKTEMGAKGQVLPC